MSRKLRFLLARLASFLLVIVIAIVAVQQIESRSVARNEQTHRADANRTLNAELRICARVQVLRDQTNGLTFVAYDAYRGAQLREERLAKTDAPINRQSHLISARQSKVIADNLVVTGPTDCLKATLSPETYSPPAPEFIRSHTRLVEISRKRSNDIVKKAKLGIPLYQGYLPVNKK